STPPAERAHPPGSRSCSNPPGVESVSGGHIRRSELVAVDSVQLCRSAGLELDATRGEGERLRVKYGLKAGSPASTLSTVVRQCAPNTTDERRRHVSCS